MFSSSFQNFWTLLARMKATLEADATVAAYNEIVSIGKYREDRMPSFTNYGIILVPIAETENNGDSTDRRGGTINSKRFEWDVNIVALVRQYNPEHDVIGTTPPDIGILYHVAKIKDALRAKSFTGYLEVSKFEMNGLIEFNEIRSGNRDDFFHEVIIPWHGLGRDDVAPDVSP